MRFDTLMTLSEFDVRFGDRMTRWTFIPRRRGPHGGGNGVSPENSPGHPANAPGSTGGNGVSPENSPGHPANAPGSTGGTSTTEEESESTTSGAEKTGGGTTTTGGDDNKGSGPTHVVATDGTTYQVAGDGTVTKEENGHTYTISDEALLDSVRGAAGSGDVTGISGKTSQWATPGVFDEAPSPGRFVVAPNGTTYEVSADGTVSKEEDGQTYTVREDGLRSDVLWAAANEDVSQLSGLSSPWVNSGVFDEDPGSQDTYVVAGDGSSYSVSPQGEVTRHENGRKYVISDDDLREALLNARATGDVTGISGVEVPGAESGVHRPTRPTSPEPDSEAEQLTTQEEPSDAAWAAALRAASRGTRPGAGGYDLEQARLAGEVAFHEATIDPLLGRSGEWNEGMTEAELQEMRTSLSALIDEAESLAPIIEQGLQSSGRLNTLTDELNERIATHEKRTESLQARIDAGENTGELTEAIAEHTVNGDRLERQSESLNENIQGWETAYTGVFDRAASLNANVVNQTAIFNAGLESFNAVPTRTIPSGHVEATLDDEGNIDAILADYGAGVYEDESSVATGAFDARISHVFGDEVAPNNDGATTDGLSPDGYFVFERSDSGVYRPVQAVDFNPNAAADWRRGAVKPGLVEGTVDDHGQISSILTDHAAGVYQDESAVGGPPDGQNILFARDQGGLYMPLQFGPSISEFEDSVASLQDSRFDPENLRGDKTPEMDEYSNQQQRRDPPESLLGNKASEMDTYLNQRQRLDPSGSMTNLELWASQNSGSDRPDVPWGTHSEILWRPQPLPSDQGFLGRSESDIALQDRWQQRVHGADSLWVPNSPMPAQESLRAAHLVGAANLLTNAGDHSMAPRATEAISAYLGKIRAQKAAASDVSPVSSLDLHTAIARDRNTNYAKTDVPGVVNYLVEQGLITNRGEPTDEYYAQLRHDKFRPGDDGADLVLSAVPAFWGARLGLAAGQLGGRLLDRTALGTVARNAPGFARSAAPRLGRFASSEAGASTPDVAFSVNPWSQNGWRMSGNEWIGLGAGVAPGLAVPAIKPAVSIARIATGLDIPMGAVSYAGKTDRLEVEGLPDVLPEQRARHKAIYLANRQVHGLPLDDARARVGLEAIDQGTNVNLANQITRLGVDRVINTGQPHTAVVVNTAGGTWHTASFPLGAPYFSKRLGGGVYSATPNAQRYFDESAKPGGNRVPEGDPNLPVEEHRRFLGPQAYQGFFRGTAWGGSTTPRLDASGAPVKDPAGYDIHDPLDWDPAIAYDSATFVRQEPKLYDIEMKHRPNVLTKEIEGTQLPGVPIGEPQHIAHLGNRDRWVLTVSPDDAAQIKRNHPDWWERNWIPFGDGAGRPIGIRQSAKVELVSTAPDTPAGRWQNITTTAGHVGGRVGTTFRRLRGGSGSVDLVDLKAQAPTRSKPYLNVRIDDPNVRLDDAEPVWTSPRDVNPQYSGAPDLGASVDRPAAVAGFGAEANVFDGPTTAEPRNARQASGAIDSSSGTDEVIDTLMRANTIDAGNRGQGLTGRRSRSAADNPAEGDPADWIAGGGRPSRTGVEADVDARPEIFVHSDPDELVTFPRSDAPTDTPSQGPTRRPNDENIDARDEVLNHGDPEELAALARGENPRDILGQRFANELGGIRNGALTDGMLTRSAIEGVSTAAGVLRLPRETVRQPGTESRVEPGRDDTARVKDPNNPLTRLPEHMRVQEPVRGDTARVKDPNNPLTRLPEHMRVQEPVRNDTARVPDPDNPLIRLPEHMRVQEPVRGDTGRVPDPDNPRTRLPDHLRTQEPVRKDVARTTDPNNPITRLPEHLRPELEPVIFNSPTPDPPVKKRRRRRPEEERPETPEGEQPTAPFKRLPRTVQWTSQVEHTVDLSTGEQWTRPITSDHLKSLRVVERTEEPVRNADLVAGNLRIRTGSKGKLLAPNAVPLRKRRAAAAGKARSKEINPFLTRKELRRLKRGSF